MSKNWRFYKRTFSYITPHKKLIAAAILLSLLLSLTSGFATFSFLPVLNIVFETDSGAVAGGITGTVSELESNNKTGQNHSGFFGDIKAWLNGLGRWFNEKLHDVAGSGDTMSQLIRLVLFIVALSVSASILSLLVDFIFIYIQSDGVRKLRYDTFSHLSQMPLGFFNNTKTGEIISRVTHDVGGAIGPMTRSIANTTLNLSLAVVYLALLFFLNVRLALVTLPIVILIGLFAAFVGRWTNKNQKKILELRANVTTLIQEFLSGIKIIKGFATEGKERKKWKKNINSWRKLEVISNLNKSFPKRFSDIATIIIVGVVLIFGGSMITGGTLVVSELILFFVVLTRFQTPVSVLSRVWFEIQIGLASAERVFSFLDLPHDSRDGQEKPPSFNDKIEFRGVSFAYEKEEALKAIDFEIKGNQKVALVGPSGSGKTSVADLLLRFYDPARGEILLDGKNIKEFSPFHYRALFGMVTQETFLFHDTVLNNIRYGVDKDKSREDVVSASKAAYAHAFIKNLPRGYNTIIGERGVRLSGGERQRIAIARAILRDPKVLIMDEATSALDSESERFVRAAMKNLMKDRTALVIAHRLSTIHDADLILVINEGKIIERGTHGELVKRDGLYRHLYNLSK